MAFTVDWQKKKRRKFRSALVSIMENRVKSGTNRTGEDMRTGTGATDWDRLNQRFEDFRMILVPLEPSSKDDFERLKLSILTYGKISSVHLDDIHYGLRFYADDDNTFYLLDDVLTALGFKDDPEPGWTSPFDIVRNGLESQSLSTEFVRAWGMLEWCTGVICVLRQRDHTARPEFNRRLKGAKNDVTVQKHWYAHWMLNNAPSLDKDAWEEENVQLAVLCGEIQAGIIAPWPPYPKEWFGTLLAKDDAEVLNSTLTRLSKPAILAMIKHRFLTPDILPPLCPDEFERVHN